MTSVDPLAALLFSIGPVQDFIATARKGQDLWFGSWLLSELAQTAAKTAEAKGAVLIMPDSTSLKAQGAVANKVLARVAAKDAVAIAQTVERAARKKLAALAKSVFDHVAGTAEGTHLRRNYAWSDGAAGRLVGHYGADGVFTFDCLKGHLP